MHTKVRRWLGVFAWCAASGCARPYLNPEGMLVFAPEGGRGAAVVTSQGVVFRDVVDPPERVVFRDPSEPWRAPIGFLLPRSGRFRETSEPVTLTMPGLAVVLRSSDTRMPAWGGEILVRVDAHALGPLADRPCEHLAIVLDVEPPQAAMAPLEAALERLGACDRLSVVDSHGPRVKVPEMPATHRALAMAAATRTQGDLPTARHAEAALLLAERTLQRSTGTTRRRLLVVSSAPEQAAPSAAIERASTAFGADAVLVADARDQDLAERLGRFVPAAGPARIRDLTLRFEGVPAPSHVLEASGGDVQWVLDGGVVSFGDLLAGQARYEVLRVSVPAWVPRTRFRLSVQVTATLAEGGATIVGRASLQGTYDDDLERIAESRHGDVIAYASALATMSRLQDAFVQPGQPRLDLLKVARMQARSLSLLARDFPNRGFTEDARVLESLLQASSPAPGW